jgi:hypothetical protein
MGERGGGGGLVGVQGVQTYRPSLKTWEASQKTLTSQFDVLGESEGDTLCSTFCWLVSRF